MSANLGGLRSVTLAAALLSFQVSPGHDVIAQRPSSAADASDIPNVPFEKYALGNGLEVILSEDHRLPRTAVHLIYHVGPANEDVGRSGFAHLFEHMMFQSSKHVPPDSHFKLIQGAGGTTVNGTTDWDRTSYFETVPSNQLELALWLESDRMGYLLDQLDEAALANQQDVVRNERRQSENAPNSTFGQAFEVMIQMLYPAGHPYHGRIIGSHEDIQAAKLGEIKRFFKQYYAPNNASLVIAGDIDKTATKALVEKYFGTLRRGDPVPPIRVETPRIAAERRRVMTDRVQLPRIYMAWITPPIFTAGDADALITAGVLGDGRSSRLYKRLVYEKQIAQDVMVFQDSEGLSSYFLITATAQPGKTAAQLEEAIDQELASMRSTPPAASEVERARNLSETRLVQNLERLGGFGGVADQLNIYNHYLHDPGYLRNDVARMRAVTTQRVQTFVRDLLTPAARIVLHVAPGERQLPPDPPAPPAPTSKPGEGAEAINAPELWRNETPKGAATRAFLLPVPQTARLANGLTLVLLEKKGLPIVSAELAVNAGNDANPPDKPGLASFTAAMLDEGTSSRSATQIADDVAQLGGSLATGSEFDASSGSVTALKKSFAGVVNILADVVRHPTFPADEIERQRARRLGQLVQQQDNPVTLGQQTAALVLYGAKHPYGYLDLGSRASITALTRADMVAFWKNHYVPNNAALIVAGDVTMAELRSIAQKTFGDWQRGPVFRAAAAPPSTTAARVVIVDKPGSPQTQVRVVSLGAPRSTPDYEALVVMNQEFGAVFSSRINMNLREAHGYTYGANSVFSFRRTAGPFAVVGSIRTDVTAPAITEIFNEIRGIRDAVIPEEALQRARTSIVLSLPATFETSTGTVASIANTFIYNLGVDYYRRYSAKAAAITAQQAQAVARKHLLPERFIVVAVGDRAKIEGPLKALALGPIEIRNSEGAVISN